VRTRWVHFPLHPETPADGVAIRDLFRDRDPEQMRAMRDRMRALMADAGLPYGDRTMTYNSRLAQELGAWADSVQADSPLHDLLFRAYFVDNRNIGDIEVLVELAAAAGLDADEARTVLERRTFADTVSADWKRAWENGVTGVPTFTSRELYVVGCQPYEILQRFVNHLKTLAAGGAG